MKSKKIRIMLRWMHFILGVVILCYVYSPFHRYIWYQMLMKFIIVPVVVLTGIWIWKFALINRFLKIQE